MATTEDYKSNSKYNDFQLNNLNNAIATNLNYNDLVDAYKYLLFPNLSLNDILKQQLNNMLEEANSKQLTVEKVLEYLASNNILLKEPQTN